MAKKQQQPKIVFRQAIKVPVEDDGEKAKLLELAEVDREIDSVAAEKSANASEFNAQLKGLRKTRKGILDVLTTKIETVDVECYQRINEQLGEVEVVRCDNDQVIPELTRALTAEERQMSIEDIPLPTEDERADVAEGDQDDLGDEGEDEDDDDEEAAE